MQVLYLTISTSALNSGTVPANTPFVVDGQSFYTAYNPYDAGIDADPIDDWLNDPGDWMQGRYLASFGGGYWTETITAMSFTKPADFDSHPIVNGADKYALAVVDDSFVLPGPPVAVGHSVVVGYNTDKVINLLAGDYDPAGGTLSLTGVTQPKHGLVQIDGNGNVTYTPDSGYLGTDAFTYTIKDSLGMSAKATVSVSVKWQPIIINLGTLGPDDEAAITLPAEASGEMVVYEFTTNHPMYLDGALERTSADSLSAYLTTGLLKASLSNVAPTLGAGKGGYVDIGVGQEAGSTTDLYQDPIMPGTYTFEINKSPTANNVTVQLNLNAYGASAGYNKTWAQNLGVLAADGAVASFTGFVNPIDDKDMFKFTLSTASNVMIALQTEDMDGPTLTVPETPFRLWDGSNLVVYTGTATSNPLPKGTYYIEVDNGRSLDPANENYNLFVASWADKAGNTPTSALALGNLTGKTLQESDYVGLADRNDYYAFTLSAKTKLDISLASTSGLDVDWQLMSVGTAVNRTVNITELDTGSGVPDAMPVLNAGTYWIRVYSADTYVFPSAWQDPFDLPDSPGPNYTLNLTGQKIATPAGPAPTVTKVGVTPGKGSEVENSGTVTITLTFNTIVSVSGTPALTLNDGGSAVYTSGAGTTTLTFTYTVGANDHTAALAMTGGVTGGLVTDANGQIANISAVALGVQINIDSWLKAVSADWLTAADWSRGAAPSGSDFVLLTAAGTYTVSSGQTETIAGLTLAGTATLALGGGTFTVTGSASNAGKIAVNAGTLHIEGAATGSGVAVIAGPAEAELSGTGSTMRVNFAAAATGTLLLDASQSFTGMIGGFAPNQGIDLADVSYVNGHTAFSYAPGSPNTAGVLTVTDNTGHIAHLHLAGAYGVANFQIGSDGHGGTLLTEQKIIAPPAGNAPIQIAAGDVLKVSTAYKGAVTFTGGNESLWLSQPSSFTGTVSGFGTLDVIDLPGIIYNSNSATPGYTPNASSTGGTLTVSDGSHTASIALLGNYSSGNFTTASDGHGGTLVVDPAAPVAVAAGATVDIGSNFSGQITFEGSTGTIVLEDPSSFSGTVAGMTGQDIIDLSGFSDQTTGVVGPGGKLPHSVTTSFSGTSVGGTLTVTDTVGSLTAQVALLGNYLASTFSPSSDNNGGTSIVDPPAAALLTTVSQQSATSLLSPSH